MRTATRRRHHRASTRPEIHGKGQKRQTGSQQAALALTLSLLATPAFGQGVSLRGVATVGTIAFDAQNSFDAVFGTSSGFIYSAGGQLLLPGGIYVEVTTSLFKKDDERALEIRIKPVEVTGGWRYRRWERLIPYGGAGYSSYGYQETTEFAGTTPNADERFSGFHIVGGVEYLPLRWLGIGGELARSSIPEALAGAVPRAFNEDNLGGTTLRLKLALGR